MRALHSPVDAAQWLQSRVSGALHADSRRITPGDGFIAWPGAAADGRRHVPGALAQGAQACLVERKGVEDFAFEGDGVASYAGLKAATGPIAAAYYGDPGANLAVVAVTGTNGKTSTAWWLAQALTNLPGDAAMRCGVIGTLGIGVPPSVEFNGLTTPDPVLLQRHLRQFVDQGFKACAMEASSVGIAGRRLDGTPVHVAVFTNFSQDHLDYHQTMATYWAAKAELFAWPGLRAAVVNVDDAKGAALAQALEGGALELWTLSCTVPARLRAQGIGYASGGVYFTVVEGGEQHLLQTRLIGDYNVANLLGVIGAMRALGVPLADAVRACGHLQPVPGRMEQIASPGQPLVAVDYAHTPDALDKTLQALRPLAQARAGQLWCVFGCGGERDATKRPLMAAVAEKWADHVVVTSDNPRSEKPEAIISQILLGLSRNQCVQVEADRARAISSTLTQAAANDVVLIAGKGHETYQEVAGVKHPFADTDHARRALALREAV